MSPGITNAQRTGQSAETVARRHLEKAGLSLIERNFRSRQGEIDLVMRDGDTLVFVEVRYRRQDRFGTGAESVDRRKRMRLVRAAQYYLLKHPADAERPCRFDVVSLAPSRVDWIRDAFSME